MEKTHDEEMAIDLWELISALKKRALIILAACLLGGVVAGRGRVPEGGADAPQPDLDRCEALSGAAAGAPGHERAVRRCGS